MLRHPSGPDLRRADDDPLAFLERLAASEDDLVACAIGRRPAFLLTAPALIDEVLVRQPARYVKGRGYTRAARLLGDGLLTAPAPVHAAHRRAAQPAFRRGHVETYAGTMVRHAVERRDHWRDGAPVDIAAEMQELTLAIAGESLFGADLRRVGGELRAAVAEALPPMDGLLAVVAPPHRIRRARRQLDGLVEALIAERLRGLERFSGVQRFSGGRRPTDVQSPGDLLDLLLDAYGGDLPRLRDEAVTFLLAGHDTMAHALTWTWLLLAEHPDAEARLRAELDRVLGSRTPAADDLPALGYTRGVFAEALRVRPPAWVIVREAAVAHDLAGRSIPAGALIIVSPWVTHHDARFFHQPRDFRPDRWTAPEPDPRPRLAYLPFGAGSRSCIGEHFAWMEGTLVLATVAQRWRLGAAPPTVRPTPLITLRPSGPVRMTPIAAPAA